MVAVLFGLINVIHVVLVAVAGALAGLGLAAAAGGLLPTWLRPAVVVGAVLLAVAALPAVAEVHGSPVLGVGLLGFLIWLLFLAVAGTRMLRGAA